MGRGSLEASLRARLLGYVGVTVLAVAAASIAVTAHALSLVDDDVARSRAEAALRMLRIEEAEGDAPDVAMHEVVLAADADGIGIVLRDAARLHRGATTSARKLTPLRPGSCRDGRTPEGRLFRACTVADARAESTVAVPIDAHRAALVRLALSMIAVVALALAAIAGATRQAIRGPLASLRALVTWSEETAARETLASAPAPRGVRELDQLGVAFDALVRRLFDALQRERATSAHMAHELRTPLTTLRLELEASPPFDEPSVARMRADVERLERVIEAILILARPLPTDRPPGVVNVADLVRDMSPPGARIEAPDEALVSAEARLVEIALRNLLDNAERYGGGATAVSVTREDDCIRITVADDGPGLDEEARARMFDRYWRGGGDGAGSGLGLALVRAVAERHGGVATARPPPSGRGLEVALTLSGLAGWHPG